MFRKTGFLVILFSCILISAGMAQDFVAVTIKSRGEVKLTHPKETRVISVSKGQVMKSGDKVTTGRASFCAIKFLDDKSLLRIKEKSSCIIRGEKKGDRIDKNIFVQVGAFFASLFKPKGSFTITTPTSVASVKGTQFWTVQFPGGKTMYIALEGAIDISNNTGRALLRKGWTAIVTSMNDRPLIRLTTPADFQLLGEEGTGTNSLEIEFKNARGQIKKLRIDYQEK